MSEGQVLPDGWVTARIEDVAQPSGSWSPKAHTSDEFWYVDIEALDNACQVITSPKRLKVSEAPSRARVAIKAGDVLFSLVRPYLKNIAIVPDGLDGQVASTAYCAIRPSVAVNSKYLYYSFVRDTFIESVVTYGNSPPSGHDDEFLLMQVPVAPLAEQRRIVAAIEEQFTRLDAGVAALKRAQAALKRYRAAVLKAAVEGKLTASWRLQHPDVRPAGELLADILAERRARWEADLRAKGKDPAKAKYDEPQSPQTEGLPELPQGWVWATVEQLASSEPRSLQSGPFGSALHHSEFQDTGVLAIGIDNVLEGQFSIGREHRIAIEKYQELARFTARPLDVLVTVMATVGRCCVVPADLETAIITKHVYRVTPNQRIAYSYFVMHALQGGPEVRRQLFGQVQGQTRPGINGEILRGIALPIPPLSEQEAIVSEIEQRLSVVTVLEATIAANLKRAERLRQAILERAFTGRLVPQDASDEPASALLERIRQEREDRRASGRAAVVETSPTLWAQSKAYGNP